MLKNEYFWVVKGLREIELTFLYSFKYRDLIMNFIWENLGRDG